MPKSHECQRAKVLQEKGEQRAEDGRVQPPPYRRAPGYMEQRRKTALMAVGEVSSEPPYSRGEAVTWESFRR